MNLVMYYPPNGKSEILEDIQHVYPEDKKFFEENDYVVSIEPDLGAGENAYILYGRPSFEEEEEEIIVFSYGRSCEDSLHELAVLCKTTFGD